MDLKCVFDSKNKGGPDTRIGRFKIEYWRAQKREVI